MTKVTGVFESKLEANKALADLLNQGFSQNEISLLVTDKSRDQFFTTTDDEVNRVAKGGAAGAAIGGTLGAIVAGLTAVGAIALPGAGLLVAGPLVAALSGAGAGAAVGGLSGALIKAGFPSAEAERYEEDLKKGKAIIVVDAENNTKANIARSVLNISGGSVKAA